MKLSLSAQVKSQLNIVDMMRADGLNLKVESGDRYSCKCPFHNEKTPSFKVDESFQNYHCFGCGASGDAIQYFAQQNALDYKAATLTLAEKLGIKIDKKQQDNFSKQKRLLELASCLYEFYKKEFSELSDSHPAKRQILDRNLKIDGYEEYFGYAPFNGKATLDYILSKGFTIDEMKELGYVNEKDNIQLTNRLIFTIKNYMGTVSGFSGRDLSGSDNFKYVNSKSSIIFDKSQALFNIDKAKKSAKKNNVLFLVEGQFDVIAMVQNGYENTVAISGTAFTSKHIGIINKAITDTGKIVLCLDGDSAGQKAALKIFQENPSIQARLYIITFPNKQDPCEFLQNNKQLPKPIKFINFLFQNLRRKYPPNILENRQKFIEQVQEKITQYITDKSLKEIYLKSACSMVGISYSDLKQKTFKFFDKQTHNEKTNEETKKISKEDSFYINSLAIYIKHSKVLPEISKEDYPARYSKVIEELIENKENRIMPELFTNSKLVSKILEEEVHKVDDELQAKDYYDNILNMAKKETKKNDMNKKKIEIINSLQGLSSKDFLEALSVLD